MRRCFKRGAPSPYFHHRWLPWRSPSVNSEAWPLFVSRTACWSHYQSSACCLLLIHSAAQPCCIFFPALFNPTFSSVPGYFSISCRSSHRTLTFLISPPLVASEVGGAQRVAGKQSGESYFIICGNWVFFVGIISGQPSLDRI